MKQLAAFFLFLAALFPSVLAGEGTDRILPLVLPEQWTVFCPESIAGADLNGISEIPAELCGAKASKVNFVDYAYNVNTASSKSGPAVFMYEFESDQDGIMQAGAGADWFWSIMINGEVALDLLKRGNSMGPITHTNHHVYLPVRKGRNIVIATVFRGSMGWKFAYGPVPFNVNNNGIIYQDELGASDCVLTYQDGTTVSQQNSLKEVSFTGKGKNFDLSGNLAPGVQLLMISRETRTRSGNYAIKLDYTLKSDKPFEFGKAAAMFRLPADVFAEGEVEGDGKEYDLAKLPSDLKDIKILSIVNDKSKVTFEATSPLLMVRANANTTFDVVAEFTDLKDKTSATVSFQIIPGVPPFKIVAGKEWVKLPFERTVRKGSILDFSFLADKHAPAGKYGRIAIDENGHFVYEKTGERARLNGANLCFEANYIEKDECDELAEVFRKNGYNSVRFHHTDVHMIKGNWRANNSYEVEPGMMDKFDYMFYAMKKAGLYPVIDFYTMRYFGPGEIAEVNTRMACDIKALLPVSDSALNAWAKLVITWMNHVNPYTGIAWKDDPALVFSCPLNEDSICSVLRDNTVAMNLFKERYSVWKEKNGIVGEDISQITKDPRFTRFVIEAKRESNRKIAAILKENGINIPLSGSNWWNTQAQTFTRSEFDIVDNHQYADHPANGSYHQSCSIRGQFGRINPIFMTPTRVFGKPFTVTEFNYCFPNMFRAEGGALFGAYSALQDWDAVYRFAWSHSRAGNLVPQPIKGFDIASDPISLFADRQIALLFTRGDVQPATRKYLYAVNMTEATRDGFGGMWSGGLFPSAFSSVGIVSQVGSQIVDGDSSVKGTFDGVSSGSKPAEKLIGKTPYMPLTDLSSLFKADGNGEISSDNSEIKLNPQKGYLKVITPKTECFVTFPGESLTGKCLGARGIDTFTSISASAMDERPLADSARVLVFHLTNVLNTNMKFSNNEMRRIEGNGTLPHLVRVGSVDIALKNSNSDLNVFAIDSTGKRVRKVDVKYSDGEYRFKATISDNGDEAVMAYELAK